MHRSYMGRQATCDVTLTCLIWTYSLIGHIPQVFRASSTRGHSESHFILLPTVTPTILLATRLWNTFSASIMAPVTTQILIPYYNTNLTTALYSIPCARTTNPVFFTTIAHHRPPPPHLTNILIQGSPFTIIIGKCTSLVWKCHNRLQRLCVYTNR